MPYEAGLVRCNITAKLGTSEVVVHTLWVRFDQASGRDLPGELQGVADRVRDSWQNELFGGPAGGANAAGIFWTGLQYEKVTAYAVNNLGRATAQAEAVFPVTIKGLAPNTMPPQCAVVVTTLSDRPGRSGRGRMYLGGLNANELTPDGRLKIATRDNLNYSLQQFLIAVRDTSGVGDAYRPVVVSPTLGQSFKITKVACGDAIDTMRSRRNALTEAKNILVVDAS